MNREPMPDGRERFPLFAMILVGLIFLTSGIAFVYKVPPFENSDELGHFGYVVHLVKTGHLPQVTRENPSLFRQEGYQAPLYYLSCVPVALLFGFPFDPVEPAVNPKFKWSPVPPGQGEHRFYQPIHPESPRSLQEMGRACIRLRWVSLLWGLIAGIVGARLLWYLSEGSRPVTLTGFLVCAVVSEGMIVFALYVPFFILAAAYGT